jgi:putative endonuclease
LSSPCCPDTISQMKTFFVYIMASRTKVLYTGVSSNLRQRVSQHKSGHLPGFTAQYHVTSLVYFESFSSAASAIRREKQIKGWRREKKLRLIMAMNPQWADLAADWFPPGSM